MKSRMILILNYTALDAKRRKYASALPLTFTPTYSPDNAQKPQIWPISAKKMVAIMRKIHRVRPKCLETPNFTRFTKSK